MYTRGYIISSNVSKFPKSEYTKFAAKFSKILIYFKKYLSLKSYFKNTLQQKTLEVRSYEETDPLVETPTETHDNIETPVETPKETSMETIDMTNQEPGSQPV